MLLGKHKRERRCDGLLQMLFMHLHVLYIYIPFQRQNNVKDPNVCACIYSSELWSSSHLVVVHR